MTTKEIYEMLTNLAEETGEDFLDLDDEGEFTCKDEGEWCGDEQESVYQHNETGTYWMVVNSRDAYGSDDFFWRKPVVYRVKPVEVKVVQYHIVEVSDND